MSVVRIARAEDIPTMLEMGRNMHDEGRFAHLPYDPGKLVTLSDRLVRSGAGQLFVCESAGKTIGMAICQISEYYFCSARYVSDLLLYVVPECRGGMSAVKLVRAIEDWARSRGLGEVALGVYNPEDGSRIGELYEKLGYAYVGGLYKRRV